MRRRLIVFGIPVALLALGAALLPLHDWSELLENALAQLDPAAAMLLFCAVAVLASLLLVPAWIFPLVAGAAFGLAWGFAVALASATLAAVAAFLLARYAMRERIAKLARASRAFKAVDQAVAKDGWKIVALLRMSPVLPSALKSYLLGVTRVSLPDFAGASAAGMVPGMLLKVYIGDTGRGAFVEGGALDWALLAAGVVATIALSVIVGRKLRARLGL